MTPAQVAQLVEHFLGKEEVTGSIPVLGSSFCPREKDRIRKWFPADARAMAGKKISAVSEWIRRRKTTA